MFVVGRCVVSSVHVFLANVLSLLIRAALVVALRSHGKASAVVAEEGLGAIANLSLGNAANRTRLTEAGACEGVRNLPASLLCLCFFFFSI